MTESLKTLIKLYELEDFNFTKINEIYSAEKDGICCFIKEYITINNSSMIKIGFYKQNDNVKYDLASYNGNSIIIYHRNKISDRFVLAKDGEDDYVKYFSYYDCQVNYISCCNINEFNDLSYHEASDFSLSYKKQFRIMNNDKPNFYKFKDSFLYRIAYYDNQSRYNREDGPALINLYSNFKPESEEWYKEDRRFNKNGGPISIQFYTNGKPVEKRFNNSNLETINYNSQGKVIHTKFRNGTTGNFPTSVSFECNRKTKYVCIRWLRNEFLVDKINGLSEIELVDKKITLYFYKDDELVTDELAVAIMENNLSKLEKKIINNLRKLAEED